MSGLFVFAVLSVFAFKSISATAYKDCGTSAATIASVDVLNCPDGTIPCPLKHNTNVTLTVKLTPNEASKGATTKLYGIIAGAKVPFPTEADACKSSVSCPIASGKETTYSMAVFVDPSYPKLRLVIQLELTADDGKDFICVTIPAEIVS